MQNDVKCKDDFVLLIKAENGNPACVKPTSMARLLAQGWVTSETLIPTQIKIIKPITVNASNFVENASNLNKHPSIRNATSATPLPQLVVTPTISSTKPGIVKILAVGMSPNPLKVGETPEFTVTYQNISDKPVYHVEGCGSSLWYIPSPEVNLEEIFQPAPTCPQWEALIQPNHVITDGAAVGLKDIGYYKIIRPGILNVTFTLNLDTPSAKFTNYIQFQINATQ